MLCKSSLFVGLMAILFLPVAARAQVGETTEIIRGRITDAEGRPVAGARVVATSIESNISRTATTDSNGRYTLLFRDGGGRYQVTVSFIGYADRTFAVVREADEDVLIANAELSVQAIAVEGIEVRANRVPPGRGETAQQGRDLPDQLLQRLPIDNFDPTTLATLSPGVVATNGDSADARGGFSVAGQRDALNQVTLDGGSFGSALTGGSAGSPLSVPQEGVRRTQVITSTFDVSRGQFSGGQVAMTSRGGNNRLGGSVSWNLRDPALQSGGNNVTGNAYSQNRLSGGLGGPLIRNRLFYNVAGTLLRRRDNLFALRPADPLAIERLGTDPDSVTRFLDIIQNRYGLSLAGQTGAYHRTGDALSILSRLDWNATDAHSIMVRANANLYDQGNARIGMLELRQNGGEIGSDGFGGMVSVTSRLGQGWINDFRLSFNRETRDQLPFTRIPEGRVRVTSILENGTRSITNLLFGGERSMPVKTREDTRELMDELSFLLGDTHRLKLGILINQNAFTQLNTNNTFGSFTFNSLADFEAARAASFTRTLAPRSTGGGGVNAALYAGDTWRPANELQITYGARLERSSFEGKPAYNPDVEAAFGRRTDDIPAETHLSPRIGFSWRLSRPGHALKLVRGGVGEFRGRAPFSLFAAATDQTGLANGERRLVCIGRFVPAPDWAAYSADETSVPASCNDGSTPGPLTRSQANVTVFSPDFGAPKSWRASLGYQASVGGLVQLSLDAMYTRGVGLYGVRDLNLNAMNTTRLSGENRLYFGDPSRTVAPGTGETTVVGSRSDARFGHVFELDSDLQSSTAQLTAAVSGLLPPRLVFQASWTLMRARDQSSFSCCNPQQGFAQPTTAGNPNLAEWATSNFDRRHVVTGIVGYSATRFADISLIHRLTSGQPFTPMVGGDVNGDGVRNDRAFVFDPAMVADTALAHGMSRLLATGPGPVRACLQHQIGRIADRNSCRGEWFYSLDSRINIRPATTGLARRVNISLDLSNVLAGLDRLLHGNDPRGWGQPSRPDMTLLYPRGFDRSTTTFRYAVNEQFGRSRTRWFGFGQPFQAQIQVRVSIGAQSGFGGIAALAGGRRGGFRGGPGARADMARAEGERFDPQAIFDRLLANNALVLIIEMRDSLQLTADQVTRLQALRDSLKTKLEPLVAEAKQKLGERQDANQEQMGEVFREIGPSIRRAREEIRKSMQEAQKVLTSEQWKKLPENLKNAARASMRLQP